MVLVRGRPESRPAGALPEWSGTADALEIGPVRVSFPPSQEMKTPAAKLIGSSPLYCEFLERLSQVARSDATVLVTGESGSGKGQVARVLHARSRRAAQPFVSVHLAAVSPSLVESELFGHERGAFTGAVRDRAGSFRRASGGTLLLDDVGLLPGEAQVKLLRVLQERQVDPLGGEAPIDVDVRVVATSGSDLGALVRSGGFREDLYYRLAVVPLEVPPLRVHLEDLPEIAEHALRCIGERLGLPPRRLSQAALERLAQHPWPGNVRELENALERVLVLGSKDEAAPEVGPEEFDFLAESTAGVVEVLAASALAHGLDLESIGRAMMACALEQHRGNVSAAARQVGLTRRAFEYRLRTQGSVDQEESA